MELTKSPMAKYISLFDLKNINLGYNEYWIKALQSGYQFWNQLIKEEINYRESHFRNLVFSIEGSQGDGKTAGLLSLGGTISKAYDTKLSLDHIHFFHETLREDLAHFKERTFYAQDEQTRIFGVMSSFLQAELSNYEDIYRKPQVNIGYASPSLRYHEHFFIFEALDQIYLDPKTGKPCAVELMLKTKRRSDGLIMPRGNVRLSWPEWAFWEKYNKKKDQFIKDQGGEKGDRLKILEDYADKAIKKYRDNMLTTTKDGELKIKDKTALSYYLNKVAGMGNLTGGGLELAQTIIREKLLADLEK